MWSDGGSSSRSSSADVHPEEQDAPFERSSEKPVVQIVDPRVDPPKRAGRRGSLFDTVSREMMDQSVPKVGSAPRRNTRFFGMEGDLECSGKGDASVRANMLRRRTMRQEHLQQLVDRANKRLEVAQNRRQFLKTEPDAKAAAMWMSILAAYVFVYRLDNRRGIHFALSLFARRLGPVTRLKQLRMKRKHTAQRLLKLQDLRHPVPEDLMKDKILQHFGPVHARSIVPTMTTRVYLKGETLMYQGESGEECFFVSYGEVGIAVRSGKADGKAIETVVATGHPGSTQGAMGMISGEQRQARVFALTDVVVFVIRRHDFVRSSSDATIMDLALAEIQRQHRENIPKIYAASVDGSALSKFHLFKGAPAELLNQFRARNLLKASVFHAGEIIVPAGSPSNRLHFILSGTVMSHKEKKTVSAVENPAELLASMSDASLLVTKGDRKGFFQRSVEESLKAGVGVLKERSAIGGPAFLLMEPYPLTLVAQTPVDTISIESRDFVQLLLEDPSTFKHMRSQACDALASWLKPMQKHVMLQAMFPDLGATTMNSLRVHQRRGWFDPVPQVLLRGEIIDFDPDNRYAYIVVSGSFDGISSTRPGQPVMWPAAPVLFFSHVSLKAKVSHRVEAWRISRRDFLSVLRAALNEEKMSQLYMELASHVEQRPGKAPQFEELPGVTIPNPFLGSAPPPPPPLPGVAANRRRRERRASVASHGSDKPSAEGNESIPVIGIEDEEMGARMDRASCAPSTPSRSRRSSVLVLDVDESPPSDDRHPMLPEKRSRIPLLPSNFGTRKCHVPMNVAIEAASAQLHRPRSTSPRPAVSPRRPQLAQTARPSGAMAVTTSDPYERLFGQTEVAEILRETDHFVPHPPSGKGVAMSKSAPATFSRASRHSVRLDDVRRTAKTRRDVNNM